VSPRRFIWFAGLVAIAALSHPEPARSQASTPFQPEPAAPGVLRVWGPASMSDVVKSWSDGFHRFHPDIQIELRLMGSDTAIPGLYSGLADIALLGREDNVTDDNGFSRPKGYAFTRLELLNGSLDVEDKSPALAVLVDRENPVSKLTLAQLAAAVGCIQGGAKTTTTWGQLGVTGAWASKRVQVYLYDTESGTGTFFLRAVLNGSHKVNWPQVRDFKDFKRADGSVYRASQQIVDALARDPYGLAISNLRYAGGRMKVVALAAHDGGPFVVPTQQSVMDHSYPLARNAYVFIDRRPGTPINPPVRELLRYALSAEGQADVLRHHGYLPLAEPTRLAQLQKLTGTPSVLSAGTANDVATAGGADVTFVDSLPPYEPQQQVSGTIRLWGHGSPKHDFMGKLVSNWIKTFKGYQPAVNFDNRMYGTASAIGALTTGAGDLAILGEEVSPAAAAAFKRAKSYAPTCVQIATGSLDVNYFDYAHMIFVHKDNPIERLTVSQLEAVFGTEHRRSGHNIRRWGELGLGESWKDQDIHPYAWKVDEDFALFFRERVLGGSHRWNPGTREFVTIKKPDGSVLDRGQQIIDALSEDRNGIAISNLRFANASVKALTLAGDDTGDYYAPTPNHLIDQSYPLTRFIPACIDRKPGGAVDPLLREFLRFLLSREGQRALLQDSGYLPLGAQAIRAQLEMIQSDAAHSALAAERRAVAARDSFDQASGTLRIWGNAAMRPLLQRWESGFRKIQPRMKIQSQMTGSDVGMAALYSGKADLAVLGREGTENEIKAFEWIYGYKPLVLRVARGSLDRAAHSPALAVHVHKDNPLSQLDMEQLAAIFEHQPISGQPPIVAWGQLGLAGEWAGRSIHLYVDDTESGTGIFFRHAALHDSRGLNWEHLTEFADRVRTDGGIETSNAQILAALARDRYGLAVTSLPPSGRDGRAVRALRLRAGVGTPLALTRGSVIRGDYPLGRDGYAYLNRGPGKPVNEAVLEFLQYILSEQGQSLLRSTDDYLPLPAPAAAEQVKQLR
jgi:phosphate transport system substrate-binding protein